MFVERELTRALILNRSMKRCLLNAKSSFEEEKISINDELFDQILNGNDEVYKNLLELLQTAKTE